MLELCSLCRLVCVSQAIKREMEQMDSKFDKEKAQQRVAALGGGIARIKVRTAPSPLAYPHLMHPAGFGSHVAEP
jgi:hypothetical protein